MSQAATDGAAVACGSVPNPAGCLGEQRALRSHEIRVLHLALSHHRTDRQAAVAFSDVAQIVDAADIDQATRLREPEVHERHQALAAGQHFGFAIVAAQEIDGLLERVGTVIVKRRWFHAPILS